MTDIRSRNSSVELLRIIAEIGVVFLHLNNSFGGGLSQVEHRSANEYILLIIENLCICAVDLFIITSSYYLSQTNKRKLSKVIELLLQVSVFNICFYFASFFLNGEYEYSFKTLFPELFPANYYVVLYCVLYIVSPYINVLMNTLTKKQSQILIIILFGLFSVGSFTVDWLSLFGVSQELSPVSMYGSLFGYSVVNYVLLYFIGAYLGKYGLHLSKRKLLLFALTDYVLQYLLSLYNGIAWYYNNPLIILLALFIFCFFSSLSFFRPIINKLSRASFTCYLIHIPFLIKLHDLTGKIVNGNTFVMLGYYLLIAISMFSVSYIVYVIYDFIISKTLRPLIRKVDKLELYHLN